MKQSYLLFQGNLNGSEGVIYVDITGQLYMP